jgi:hypothetical protein
MMKVKVLSHYSGQWLLCCWQDCEKFGYELHKVRHHDHAKHIPCADGDHAIMVFCSERCKQLFVHSHLANGKLGPGYRNLGGRS